MEDDRLIMQAMSTSVDLGSYKLPSTSGGIAVSDHSRCFTDYSAGGTLQITRKRNVKHSLILFVKKNLAYITHYVDAFLYITLYVQILPGES